ncbi:hypothetical protein I3843_03G039700 [Carya illinoinensis]|nr:hypothetical protein I3843_03G039700 [Carya illinoinensis]
MVLSEDEKQLQEGERFETGEETGREVKDKMPRSNDTEEGLLEDDTTKVYSTVHSGEKIVKQIFQVDSPEEAASKSSGEDEGNNATVEEPHLSKLVHDGHGIQAIPREQIEKANVVFVTPKPIEEEMTKNHQDNENETKNSREEDGCLKIIKEGNVNDSSQESIGVGPIQNFEDDKKETTNLSKGETASVRACESIALGTIHNTESLENIPGASQQEEGLQGDSGYLAPTEASANNEDKNASTAQVVEDKNDNRLAETTENSAKVTPQGEEDLQQGLQINESPENILGASLVKQKGGLQGEVENQYSTESSIENRDEVTSSLKNTEIGARAIGGEEETDHALKNDEPGETDREVESPGEVFDTAKQGNGLQADDDNLVPPETSINKRDELTSSVNTFGDNHENNRLAEATENSAKTTPEGEDSEPPSQGDETGESIALETAHGVEMPKDIPDLALVKQDEGLQEECEKITPEAEIEKRHEDTSYVKVVEDKDVNLSEATENRVKATPEGQEDSEHALHKHETRESTALKTDHGVENPKNVHDSALVKQEEVLLGEVENRYSTASSIENRDKETSSIKVAEDNDKNNRPVETTENHARVTQQGEEERDQVLLNDEPGETDREVESPGEVRDTVKQGNGLQGDDDKVFPQETSINKRDDLISSVGMYGDNHENNRLAEALENSAKTTSEGEDSEPPLTRDETAETTTLETNHGVEVPKNIPDSALVKQEEVLQGEVENQYSTESSIESRDEEMSSIKVAKDKDENNRQAETTENHARVVQQGDEETDHVLQKDESGETNCEAERPREILDTVKQWNYLQEDDDNLVPETSCNKKDELTSSVEVFGDKIENNGQAEAKENSEKTTPESEEDSGHALQRDETGECIAHETNHGVEGPKNTPDPALVKQKEGLQAECEKLAPTEAEIEKRQGYISYSKVAEDNNANNKLAEDTKRNTKIPSESGEDSYKALLTDEPGETIRGLTNHNVEGPENNLDSLLVKQGEGMQGEGDNLGQTKTSIKVAEDEDNIRPIETTRNSIKVILKGEEDSEHVLQKDDPQQKPILERNHDVEKPEENLDKSLVNQEEDLQVQGEHLVPTEASMENKDKDIPNVKMAGHKAENNMQDEDRENSPKGTPKVEDSEHSLNKDARGEIIGCEADHEIESLEKIDSSPLVNQEVFLQGEGENLISKEASEERRDEDTSYMKIANCNDNDDNDGVAAEAADISVKATTKGEENLDQVLQKDEPGKQPEQLLDVVSEDKEPEYILEKMENTTLMKEEGIIQNLEETLEVEKKEETKTVDDKKEKEAAIEKVFNTTSFSEEIRVQMAEEIHNIRDRSPEFNEKELTKENSIEEQQYGALETAASSTNTEKSVIEKPATAELPSSSDEKETVKERLKEEESDVTVLKEEAGGTTLEFIKQTEATELTEKAKAENLQDCAGQSRDFTALTTIENYSFMPEVPVEEINEKLLKQEKNTIIDSDTASEAVVTEEGLKETKPDKKEHVKSFDIVPEEKGLATFETGVRLDSVDIEVQSEENSKSEEIMGKKILTVPDETGEKIEHQMEDKAPTGGIDNELSLTTRETTLDGISGDGSRDYYIMPLQEHVPTATAVGKIMEETSARDEIIDEIAKIPSSVQKTDEKLIQKEDESINPTDASELLSSDDGKDSAIEELKHADAELHMPPKRHIEKNSYETEDVEISKRGETSDLADQTEVCKLESLEVENPSDDPSKPIAVSPYQGSEKTILEQGDFVQTEGILTGVLVEKGTTGMKTNVCSHECEPTNTKNDELLAEKNLESDDLDPKLVFITESGHKDPSHETLPQTNKSQTEENSNDVQDWNFESVEPQIKPQVQGKTETKMAMETKLKAEDCINVSQTTKETITTHIVTEGVHERIQEVSGSEGINEQAIHGESELKETQKVSAEDYALEKVEDCGTKSTDYLEATDSNEQTETVKTDIQEPTREKETSGTKALKEEKLQDEFSLKPEDVTTTVVEDSEEKIKVEVDQFLEDSDNATVVPTKSIVGEVPMDDKAVKETSSDERLETITIQPHPQTEEVGSKNFRMEAVDGSESIKEQAIEQESQLKEIYEVSTEDDILKKMEDYGTKSSNYLEAKDPKKHTETIQEPTRETEASGTKAQAEEKIQDEVSLKHVDVSKTEAEDTKETIKEKIEVEADNFLDKNDNTTMVPAKPPIQEAHMDDNSNESLKTTTIQPCPQAEEVGNKKLQIEEVDGSEGIKEQAIHAASELKETHKVYVEDDILEKVKDFGTKSSDYQEETNSNEQTEVLKADVQETTREIEASGAKVCAEDDIVEKVEDYGRKSSDYLAETSSIKQTETITADTQELTRDTEASETNPLEEEKIQGEVSLKPAEISTTEAEGTSETIKEKIKEEVDKFHDEDDNATTVPTESTIREAHMDDEAVKETRSDESVETIPIQPCPLLEEVSSKKLQIEEVDVGEGIKEQATHVESELKEIHRVYAADDILEKVKDFGTKSFDYQEETNSNEQIEVLKADVQETTREIEASGAKVCAEDDIVEKVEDCGRKSSDYLVETNSIKRTETITADTQELTRDTEASETNALEEEKIQGEVSLKPEEISTTEAEGTKETIKARIKVEPNIFLDEVDNATAVPTESTIREAHMDDEAVKETRSDESVETIPIQPCLLLEEVGSKKPQIEEVDVSEGIKEQATHAESELKEIHKVYAEDDILEKVKDFGTKSSDYQEETNSNEQTEVLKADVQETTREIEASGAKVCAEDDIVEKVEDCGRKSSDYLVETSSIKQTETIKADTQELTRDTEASKTNALEEEKIQGEVSLKPAEISTTEAPGTSETIKEKIKVEANKFHDEDDNAIAVPIESSIREVHMDDEAVKETRSDESVEKIPIQPCPLPKEVSSKKLQIEEVDVSEGIKEQATHAESELKEIHKVYATDDILEKVKDFGTKSPDYQEETNSNEQIEIIKANVQETTRETEASGAKVYAEDDIVEKVEDCGRKSPIYLEETSSIKQTETITANTQELTRETEASETKAPEEEKIPGEVSLKPAEISTTEAESTKETIKEKIRVEADKFLDEGDSETTVPAKSTIREAHMDDEAVKETRSNESVETIPIQPCPLLEEVGSKKLQIEEVDVSEGIKEQATHAESELKEIHKVYAADDILEKVKDFGTKSFSYQEEITSNEQTEILKADVQETTRETEASRAKVCADDDIVEKVEDCGRKSSYYLEETSSIKQTETITANTQELTRETEPFETKAPEEEKIQGEVSLKPAEISTTEAEGTKETIKARIKVEPNIFLDEVDNATAGPVESTIREAHMDDEGVKETRLDESVETISIQPCPLPEEVGSKKLQIEEVDVSEGIKEQATHAESELKEIHKVYAEDDILEKVKDFGTKSSDYQEETNSNEQTEILKADVQETTRETEASGAKVYAEDNIVEKVEDYGRKSFDYLEETSSIKQTETITADIQELTRETKASETNALEEEKIQGEVNLKPAEISTTEAEGTRETIKEKIEVKADKFHDEDDNATVVPTESTIREAHMDDEAVKETRSDESVESIPIQPCPLLEEVGSKKLQIEEVDVSEGIKEQATHAESELDEIQKVYAEDDILEKVKEFGTKSSDYQEETSSNEQAEILKADVQETTRETEASGAKVYAENDIVEKVEDCGRKSSDYLEETSSIKQTETITANTQELTRETEASKTKAPDKEKIPREVSFKPAEISTTKVEGTKETIKEKIRVEADKFLDEVDNETTVPAELTIREAHMDDETVKETRSDECVETIPIQPCPLLEEVGSKKLQIEEVDVSEGIKEQATQAKSKLKEIHKVYAEDDIHGKVKDFGIKSSNYQVETNSNEQTEILTADVQETTKETEASDAKVYAEYDIVEKVEDCGRKSLDYLEEPSSIKQTETITTDTQELTRETEASKTKAPEEEKIQGEVSLKPAEISTTEAESTKETIKEKIKVEADKFLNEGDSETAVPAKSTIREAYMDDKSVKETRSDESVETIPIRPCPLPEELGCQKLQSEEVDVSEGIKEQATHAESELKEIHKVYAEDDILEKLKDFGTKSSDYQEETNSNEQTEILKADVQETTREKEASSAKVYAEDDIIEKVEACGRKSSDYLVETSSIKQTKTITANTQELTRDTKASKTNALEEEKIQGEVSLKPAEISTTEAEGTSETIKEKIKVEADKFHDEDDNATAVPTESTIREAHMDDEVVKETTSDGSVETIPIQPCPLVEEVGSKKLQNEEVDVSEGIKEQATHVESELKEIHKVYAEDYILEKVEEFGKKSADYKEETDHSKLTETLKADVQETTRVTEASGSKVYAEDDIFEKVENYGTKSSDYLEETDSNKQTVTITADIQETTGEIESSGRKASEERKIQDEVSLKPVQISTTKAEDTKEMIKENIKVEVDKFLHEDHNATVVPTKSPVGEAHMDDEAVKETRSNESVETIPIQSCPLSKEVGSKKLQIEEVDVSEGIKEQATHAESELKEIHKVYAEYDILEKVKNFGTKSSDYLEETDSNEQIETLKADVQETTRETEVSETKAPEEGKIQDKVSLEHVEISTTEAEDTKEMIKEKIKVEADKFLDEDDNATMVPVESTVREAHMDDEAVKETRLDESVETIPIQPCPQAEEVGSKKLQIEEVDGSEGIKEQATHAESELKEIHKVYAEDDILEKVKDFGTKSSDYQEETDTNKQTKILKVDVQETTRDTKASGAKVYAEYDIVEKVEDYGRKSFDYLEETCSIKQTETITANTQELTMETGAFGIKAPEEEKIQDKVSLKLVDVLRIEAEDTEEMIKEKVKVEADNILDEDDNATVVPAESPIRVAHMDDKVVKETILDKSLETITIQPCPQAEDFGIEEVDESEGIKEQAMHGERELKESHRVSAEDDILQKVEDYGTKSSDYLEATNPSEQAATVKANIQELTMETELSGTKAPEEENIQDEVSLKPANVSTREAEDAKEKIKEYIEVEVDKCLDENDNATAVPAESHIGEAHMDVEAVKEISLDESLETSTIENVRLEQEGPMAHKNEEKESVTPVKPGADEVEDAKTIPNAVICSKYLGVEETQETGQSLRVEKLDSDRTDEGIKEDSGTLSEAKYLGIEMVTQGEMTSGQTLPTGNREEEFQTLSSALLSLEQEHGPKFIVKEAEAIKIMEEEIIDDKNIDDSLAIKATEDACLQNKEQLQTLSSALLSEEQKHEAQTEFKKTEEESTKEVETLDDKNMNNFSAIKESEERGLEQEEPMDHEHVEKESATLEKQDTDEAEVTKTVSAADSRPKYFGVEETHEIGESLRVEKLDSEGNEEGVKESSVTVFKSESLGIETVTKDVMTPDQTLPAVILEDHFQIASSELHSLGQEHGPTTAFTDTEAIKTTKVKMLDDETCLQEEVSESLKSTDTNEVEETKTASGTVFESKYQTDETGERLTVEKLDAAEGKETKGTSETSSNSKALCVEADSKDEVIAGQTLAAGKLGEQLQTLSSSFLSREQEHRPTTAAERTEEEEMEEAKIIGDESIDNSSAAKTTEGTCLKMKEHVELEVSTLGLESSKATHSGSSNEIQEEEGSKLDQASKLDSHEKEEMKYDDSPSGVQSPLVLPKSEDMKEKHLEAAMSDLNAEENWCKETVEENQIFKNQISMEEVREVMEEKEVAKDSQSVSPAEETIIESHQGDELKAEECPEEETNKTFKATTKANQHEALKLPELIDKDSANENIEKKITAEESSYLDEAEGKNIEKAVSEQDLDYKSGETHITKEKTEVITLGEKETGVEISQKEGTAGFSEVNEITEDIQQLEKNSYAVSEIKIPGEEEPSENKEAAFITDNEDVLPVLQHPSDKALQEVELEHERPGKATEVDAEERGIECEGEKRMGASGEINKESASVDSAKMSLSGLMQRSMKKKLQEAKNLTKEREPMPSKAEIQNEEAETTQIDKARADEEEGDEHKRSEPDSDAPVMVEASKDTYAKVPHKKSHNILSGVGSKVKHSLSKVKKAITGKSSHPKTSSPK